MIQAMAPEWSIQATATPKQTELIIDCVIYNPLHDVKVGCLFCSAICDKNSVRAAMKTNFRLSL